MATKHVITRAAFALALLAAPTVALAHADAFNGSSSNTTCTTCGTGSGSELSTLFTIHNGFWAKMAGVNVTNHAGGGTTLRWSSGRTDHYFSNGSSLVVAPDGTVHTTTRVGTGTLRVGAPARRMTPSEVKDAQRRDAVRDHGTIGRNEDGTRGRR